MNQDKKCIVSWRCDVLMKSNQHRVNHPPRAEQNKQLRDYISVELITMELNLLVLTALAALGLASPVARNIAPLPTLEPFPTASATTTAASAAPTVIWPPPISSCCCCRYLPQHRSKLSKKMAEKLNAVCPLDGGRDCSRSNAGVDAVVCAPLVCPLLNDE